MADTRLEMPSEETTLLQEENGSLKASKRTRNGAGVTMLTLATLALVGASQGSEKPIPRSFQDFRDHMPTWSFLLLVLLNCVRSFLGGGWAMGPALQVYMFALPFSIMIGASAGSGWAPAAVQIGVMVGVAATVLDQLRGAGGPGWQKYINVVACGCLVVGTVKAVLDKTNDITDALPFLAWAVTAGVAVVCILLKEESHAGLNDTLWLLTLFTAAQLGAAGSAAGGHKLEALLLKIACIGGVVWAVDSGFDLLEKVGLTFVRKGLLVAIQGAIFFVFCWSFVRDMQFDLDFIMKNIATITFSVILGVRAVLSLIFVFASGADPSDRTDPFCVLFMLCQVLTVKAVLASAGGESTQFSQYAAQLAQVGPAIGLVLVVFAVLDLFGDLRSKLLSLAELITIVGILLA